MTLLKKSQLVGRFDDVYLLYEAAPPAPSPSPSPPVQPPAAETEVVSRHARLLNRITSELLAERARLLTELQPDLLALVLAMVRQIVGYELAANPRIIETTLAQALQHLHLATHITVHLHPDDLAHLQAHPEAMALHPAELDLLADAQVERGGCRLESDRGGIDCLIETQLRLLSERLSEQNEAVGSDVATD